MKRTTVKLTFDASLYPLATLRAAADAWNEVAEIRLRSAAGRVHVALRPRAGAPDDVTLAGEFANYALGLVCEERRRG